jgi:hypothetical protein
MPRPQALMTEKKVIEEIEKQHLGPPLAGPMVPMALQLRPKYAPTTEQSWSGVGADLGTKGGALTVARIAIP